MLRRRWPWPATVAFVLLIGAFQSCGGGSSPSTPVVQAQPATTSTSTTSTTTTTTLRPAPTPDPPGMCDGVTAPNRCDVGNGPPPATARCQDGQWSCSQTRSGTCSGRRRRVLRVSWADLLTRQSMKRKDNREGWINSARPWRLRIGHLRYPRWGGRCETGRSECDDVER